MYTHAKESDLGENLAAGPHKDQALARLWRKVLETGAYTFEDYSFYAPSNGQTAFVGAPVRDETGNIVAVAALQLPTKVINSIEQQRLGLGKTGESYLAAKANGRILIRSDLQFLGDGKYVIGFDLTDAAPAYVKRVLEGEEVKGVFTNSKGALVLVRADPLNVQGLNWAMITLYPLEEALTEKAAGEEEDFFAKYIKKYGYYDLFLIHPNGSVFYTVAHEADYQSNLVKGQYANSNLGELFRSVLQTKIFGMADFAPYAPSKGEPAAFIAQPILADGKVELVVGLQLSLESINAIMRQREGMGKTGETYLVGADKRMRSDSFLDPQGHSVKASFAGTIERNGVDTEASRAALGGETSAKIILDYNGNPVLSSYTPLDLGGAKWALLAEVDEAEVVAPIQKLTMAVVYIGLGLVVVILVVAWFVARGIAKPLIEARDTAAAIAVGDLTREVRAQSKDEVGEMMHAMARLVEAEKAVSGVMERIAVGDLEVDVRQRSEDDALMHSLANMVAAEKKVVDIAEELAEGNLRQNVQPRSDEDALMHALRSMVSRVSEVVSNIQSSAEQVAAGSEELSSTSEALSQGASEQAAAVEECSSSMEEMSAGINQNADNSRQTERIALQASKDAEESGLAVQEAVKAMQNIARKITIIEEIARQTDLLALNAAVEAARAGDHGKGFAVVASEVRKLAERSQVAAREISELSTNSTEIAARAGEMLVKLVPDIKKTAELVQEIAAASTEQSSGAEQVNQALQQLDQVVQQNASASEEMSSTAEELSAQAQSLQSAVAFFSIDDGSRTKVTVKTASKALPAATDKDKAHKRHKPGKHDKHAKPAKLPAGETKEEEDDEADDMDFERY